MTDADFDRILAKMHADIERTGRSVLGVFGSEGEPPFCYTIGNGLVGLPELLLIGGCHEPFAAMLNSLSEAARRNGRAFANSERFTFPGSTCPVLFVDAAEMVKARFTLQAGHYHGARPFRVQQVVLSDKAGRLPGEPGCAEPYASVPVFRPS